MALSLTSSAFETDADIPRAHTGDGGDRSPPLAWSGAPSSTTTYALIVDDPDAPSGTFVHWLAFDIPAAERGLPEGVEHCGDLTDGMKQGRNDFDRTGYGGPLPPHGQTHRYRFKLYALDDRIPVEPGATKEELERAMEGHILDEAELVGRYARTRP
jgi:Raf kinase inhibitor-like YbhB/YbcL family protein